MKKIVTIIGTRPQIIKANIVSKTISEKFSDVFDEIVVDTMQHSDYNMSNIIYNELEYKATYKFFGNDALTDIGNFYKQAIFIEGILNRVEPDFVIVYGDTNSTFVGAFVASRLNIKIAHIEAGLRSGNKNMQEEKNRILTDHLSTYLFAPTLKAIDNIRNEGLHNSILVGDVMYDSFLRYSESDDSVLDRYNIASKGYILATIHRAENINDKERLEKIFSELSILSETNVIIMSLHPHTRKQLFENGITIVDRVQVIEPVDYISMLSLERNALCIITDSGGVQREASYCEVPCLVIRDETEWIELNGYGGSYLVSIDTIVGSYDYIMGKKSHVFIKHREGACIKILEHLKNEA